MLVGRGLRDTRARAGRPFASRFGERSVIYEVSVTRGEKYTTHTHTHASNPLFTELSFGDEIASVRRSTFAEDTSLDAILRLANSFPGEFFIHQHAREKSSKDIIVNYSKLSKLPRATFRPDRQVCVNLAATFLVDLRKSYIPHTERNYPIKD